MICPNCEQSMNYINQDRQHILHCSNCGASFFEINSINQISQLTAQKLNEDKKTDEVLGHTKLCPKDKATLVSYEDAETIPQGVTLLKCPKCQGIFTYPDDLVNFKTAQIAKLKYFSTWHKALPSLKSILVLTFVSFVSVSIFTGYILQQGNISQTQAQNLIKKVYISVTGQYVFVSFNTEIPMTSIIAFKNIDTGVVTTKTISEELKTFHHIATGDINPNDNIYYQIQLKDNKGNVIKTETKKLE